MKSLRLAPACLLLLAACGDTAAPALQRVQEFCAGIQKGDAIGAVVARYEKFGLQPGGVPPAPAERLKGMVSAEVLRSVAGRLAEPAGSPPGPRPVCAIYYSDQERGGDDKTLLAEFKPEWAARY